MMYTAFTAELYSSPSSLSLSLLLTHSYSLALLSSDIVLPQTFQYGSGLTHNNQLTGVDDGSQVTEVVKKALDERMTRQHQIREQVRIPSSMYTYILLHYLRMQQYLVWHVLA